MLRPDDLDTAWFQALLSRRYPGVAVAEATPTRIDEWTNTHVRVSLGYDGDDRGAPSRVFVKLPPADRRKAEGLGSARMGAREANFYERLAPEIDLRVPSPHGAVIEDDGGFAIVIEDLTESGCRPFNARPVGVDAAAGALEDLARLHVRYEHDGARAADAVSWVKSAPVPGPDAVPPSEENYGQRLLRTGIEQRDDLTDGYVAVARRWLTDGFALQRLWWDAPLTVIHGDAHPGNLFDDAGRVGFFDWGLVCLGDPMRDVSYFLCLALDTDDRRNSQEALLATYLDARRAAGGEEIDPATAWTRHRVHAAYTVPASCQALAVPDDPDSSAARFSAVFLARAMAAVEDLESFDAIRHAE